MKKDAGKPVKKEKKEIRKNLFQQFSTEITKLVEASGYESKKAAKEIKKVANHLAKKLAAKPLQTDKTSKKEAPVAKAPAKVKANKEKTEPAPEK